MPSAQTTTKNKGKKRGPLKKIIDDAAELAANEATSEFEQELEDLGGDDLEIYEEPSQHMSPATLDVFTEAFRKAQSLNDSPRFYIRKNSQLIGFKDWPYSWERLTKDYGPGYYQIIAKRVSNGMILKQQSDSIGDPNDGREIQEEVEVEDNSELKTLAWIQSSQERAEARMREQSKSTENSFASMMQVMMQSQQASQQMMMQIQAENTKTMMALLTPLLAGTQNKGPDPMMTLVTTMLTKEKPKEGLSALEVFKMVKDAERDTRAIVEKQYDTIEKLAESRAEIIAAGMVGEQAGEESLTKSLIKGFLPVLSQAMVQQNQSGGFGQQQLLEGRQGAGPALDTEFVEPERVIPVRPQGRAPNPNAQRAPQTVAERAGLAQNASNPRPVVQNPQPPAQDRVLNAEEKRAVLDGLAPGVGQAMIGGQDASKTALEVLGLLEKRGVTRQTVVNTFTLEDFYTFADTMIPAEFKEPARAWLKEFFDAFQISPGIQSGKAEPASAEPTRRDSAPERPVAETPRPVEKPGAKLNGKHPVKPVAKPGNKPDRNRSRNEPREPGKDI